jgi:hypothetical protein
VLLAVIWRLNYGLVEQLVLSKTMPYSDTICIASLVWLRENQTNNRRAMFGCYNVTPVILEIGESRPCISELLKATNTALLTM